MTAIWHAAQVCFDRVDVQKVIAQASNCVLHLIRRAEGDRSEMKAIL
jgi:hypothetical protein